MILKNSKFYLYNDDQKNKKEQHKEEQHREKKN